MPCDCHAKEPSRTVGGEKKNGLGRDVIKKDKRVTAEPECRKRREG